MEGESPELMLSYIMRLVSHKMDALQSNPLCEEKEKDAFCRTLLQREDLPEKLFAKLKAQLNKAQALRTAFTMDRKMFQENFAQAGSGA